MVMRKATIIGGSAFLIALVVLAVVATVIHEAYRSSQPSDETAKDISTNYVVHLCHDTDYEQTCINTLSGAKNTSNPRSLVEVTFQFAIEKLSNAINQTISSQTDPNTIRAYETCQKLLHDSIYDLNRTFIRLDSFDINNLKTFTNDLKTWLTGALTYQETCLDYFENAEQEARLGMQNLLQVTREITINSLALVNVFSKSLSDSEPKSNRRLVEKKNTWAKEGYRRAHRLDDDTLRKSKPNLIVAQDGSGHYKTINEALEHVPRFSDKRFVIHIKKGVYEEYVTVDLTMMNIVFIGDGPTKTKITGNKSHKGNNNLGTQLTATVVIEGDNFIAKGMGFENTAGVDMGQAVALRVASDKSIFYNCQMDGHQDTLYTQTYRQYYRDCTISGTVDFVFGNAEAVLQNCTLLIRKPSDVGRRCMVTANGKTHLNETSGLILLDCRLISDVGYPTMDNSYKAYLGRPWKPYSTTVIMNSYLDVVIDPAGWAPWNQTTAHLDTCYYAEVNNKGPGASLSRRVTWDGHKKISSQEAAKFTPQEFLDVEFFVGALNFVPLS